MCARLLAERRRRAMQPTRVCIAQARSSTSPLCHVVYTDDFRMSSTQPHLRRALTLWDLILYGVIVLQPVAPMSVFGVISDRGRGHVVTTLLLAMVGMLITAFSYG